jgi:membrane dipeptidase
MIAKRLLAAQAAEPAAGIGAKGERADTYPFVVDLRGVDRFRKLAARRPRAGSSRE